MKKIILSILFVSLFLPGAVFAVKVVDFPDLNRPTFCKLDGDDLIVLDGVSFYIYSIKTFKLKAKFGERGEGPGEFKFRPRIWIETDHFRVYDGQKNIWFSRKGEYIKEKMITGWFEPKPIKDNILSLKLRFTKETRRWDMFVYLLNSKFEEIKLLYSVIVDAVITFDDDPRDKEIRILRHPFGHMIYDDKIFIVDTRKGFFIDVFDHNGSRLYSIDKNKEIEKVKVIEPYKKKVLDTFRVTHKHYWERYNKSSFTFDKYFPPIREFRFDDKKIYIITYKVKDDKNEIIILDLKGNILDKIFVSLNSLRIYKDTGEPDPYTIHKGILYQLIENDEEETWELYKTDLASVKK